MIKRRYVFGLLFAAALVRGASPEPSAVSLLNAPLVILDDSGADGPKTCVTLGMGRGVVVQQMGEPSHCFTRDVWVYFDVRGSNLPVTEHRDALVVVFANDRVSLMRLTDAKSVRALVARQETVARSATLAAH